MRPEDVLRVAPKILTSEQRERYFRTGYLVAERDGTEAEAHWRRHMKNAGAALLKGYEKTKVRDIMY